MAVLPKGGREGGKGDWFTRGLHFVSVDLKFRTGMDVSSELQQCPMRRCLFSTLNLASFTEHFIFEHLIPSNQEWNDPCLVCIVTSRFSVTHPHYCLKCMRLMSTVHGNGDHIHDSTPSSSSSSSVASESTSPENVLKAEETPTNV